MRKWLKRIRGALGMGLTWAAAWAGVGFVFALVAPDRLDELLVASALFAGVGFVNGFTFSVALGIAERRRRFDQMSLSRFAAWGALGGFLVAAPLVALSLAAGGAPNVFLSLGVLTLMGAGSAAGSLALARTVDDRELLDAAADVDDIGMTEAEKHQLLERGCPDHSWR